MPRPITRVPSSSIPRPGTDSSGRPTGMPAGAAPPLRQAEPLPPAAVAAQVEQIAATVASACGIMDVAAADRAKIEEGMARIDAGIRMIRAGLLAYAAETEEV